MLSYYLSICMPFEYVLYTPLQSNSHKCCAEFVLECSSLFINVRLLVTRLEVFFLFFFIINILLIMFFFPLNWLF